MSEHKLSSPRVKVTVEDDDETREYTVQTDNRDMVRWDLLRSRKKWPAQREAPILFMSVVAWHALKRSGATADDVETYLDKILEIMPVDENGEPTKLDAGDDDQAADSLA